MKNSLKFASLILLLVMILFSACEKERFGQNQTMSFTQLKQRMSKDEAHSIFSQTLAQALQDEALRTYFHQQMNQVYESDFEWIFMAQKDDLVDGKRTVLETMQAYLTDETVDRYGEDLLQLLPEVSPLLAVSMPEWEGFDATTWSSNQLPGVVAVRELSSNEYEYKKFDYTGKDRILSDHEVLNPREHLLSVWDAEAYYLIGQDGITYQGKHIDLYMPSTGEAHECFKDIQTSLNAFPNFLINTRRYTLVEHNQLLQLYVRCLGLANDDAVISPRGGMCDRDMETLDERLAQFRINNWGVFTNIRNQAFENKYVFHGDVIYALLSASNSALPNTKKYVSPSLKKRDILDCPRGQSCRGRWVTASYRIWQDWDQSEFGSPYRVSWAEVDNGTTTSSFNVQLGVKFKIDSTTEISGSITAGVSRVGAAIVALGAQDVFYCDNIMRDNQTGSLAYRSN